MIDEKELWICVRHSHGYSPLYHKLCTKNTIDIHSKGGFVGKGGRESNGLGGCQLIPAPNRGMASKFFHNGVVVWNHHFRRAELVLRAELQAALRCSL